MNNKPTKDKEYTENDIVTKDDLEISEELDFGKSFVITESDDSAEDNDTKTKSKTKSTSSKKKKDKNVHAGHRERMLKRYEATRFNGFSEHEVLEMLLYHCYVNGDLNELAHKLIDNFGCLYNVLNADVNTLIISGLTTRAALILSQYKSLDNYLRINSQSKTILPTVDDVGEFCCQKFGHAEKEMFYVISLSARKEVLAVTKISEGTFSEVSAFPGEVVKTALRYNATFVVLCHNHPSGNINPSVEDHNTNKIISRVMESVGVGVIDHIICSKNKFCSMFERGLL